VATRDSWGDKKFTSICQRKETGIQWTNIEEERGLTGDGNNARFNTGLQYSM